MEYDVCLIKLGHLIHTDEAYLCSLAQERGYSVRDVPRDSDCLFSAIAVQLGIQPGEISLREQLVEYYRVIHIRIMAPPI